MDTGTTKDKKSELLPHLIIIAAFFFLLSQTWLKWGSLVIDTGRELWLPGELLKGKVLYKDIVSFYGFLPPYLIAGLYKIFGISINTLVYTGIALTLIVSFTIYRIARFFLDQGFSTLLVVNFLFVFAFGNYNTSGIFNYILPYTFASTFFMASTVLSLYFFLKFIFSDNEKNLLIWSIFLTAAFLCRLESALAVWPAFLLSGSILAARQDKTKQIKILVCIFRPLLLAALCYGVFFLATGTFYYFKETFIGSIKTITNTPFAKGMGGFDDIVMNISQISKSFLSHIIIFSGLAIFCRTASRSSDKETTSAPAIMPLLAAFLVFISLKQNDIYHFQYHCLTLILLCGTIAYLSQTLHHQSTTRSLGLLTLFTTSFFATYRIFLATSPYFYGFSLLTLPLICYYIFFCDIVKSTLENRLKIPAGLLSAVLAGFLILMIIPFWEHSESNYRYRDTLSTTSKGDLYSADIRQNDLFWKTVDYIKKNTAKDSTVVAFPEGVGINFFTDRATPLRHHSFLPHDIKLFGENKILLEMWAAKIDYIVILTRDTSEWGPASFGVDYAKKIRKWIDNDYVPIKQFGAKPYASNLVGMLIFKKKDTNI